MNRAAKLQVNYEKKVNYGIFLKKSPFLLMVFGGNDVGEEAQFDNCQMSACQSILNCLLLRTRYKMICGRQSNNAECSIGARCCLSTLLI